MEKQSIFNHLPNFELSDLEQLALKVNTLIAQKKVKDKKKRVARLLALHNGSVLSQEQKKRFLDLQALLLQEKITTKERNEYMDLAHKEEQLRNQRVKYLIEIAQLREVTLPQLMLQLGLTPPGHV